VSKLVNKLSSDVLFIISEAACTPLASSMIADYFVTQQRALALGFYNWGIYIGYSMSYAVGNLVTVSLVSFPFSILLLLE